MTAEHPNARNTSLDCVKGIAIFLVVWGHCIQFLFLDVRESYFQNPVYEFIYTFHMPLFMAVSGYLFSTSERKYPAPSLLVNKAKHLLLPVATWSVLTYVLAYAVHRGAHHVTVLHNGLWFLTSLLFCVVVALICGKIAEGHPAVYIAAILLALALPDSFGLNYDKFMLPYFVTGIMFHRYSTKVALGTYRLAWVLSVATFCILLVHWKTEYYIYTTGMSLDVSDPRHKLFIIGFRYLAGFCGIGSIVPVVQLAMRGAITVPLVWLGRHTMGIYVLSSPVLPYLNHLGIPHSNVLLYDCITTPAVAAVLCVLCIYGTKVICLSNRTSLLLLGG